MHDTQNNNSVAAVPDSSGDQGKVSLSKRQQQIQGLLDLADFYASIPDDVPFPFSLESPLLIFLHRDAKRHLAQIGSFEKCFDEDSRFGFYATKQVGGVELRFYAHRSEVCVAKVVGTRTIPAQHIPEHVEPEQFIEAHEEEIIEWDCTPVLQRITPDAEGAL